MPELPEVQTVLNGLRQVLAGKEIASLVCYYPGTVVYDPALESDPFPAKPLEFIRRGKYMLIHLTGGTSLIIHLRMTGKLVYAQEDCPPLKHERARFLLSGTELLHFIDIRTFGKIVLCKTENISNFTPKLGLEPLEAEFTPQALAKLLKGKKTPIKTALLDQAIVAGLGNIYVCEILYRCGINPTLSAGSLKKADYASIVTHSKEVLSEAIAVGGTSISDFRRIDDKTGEFQNFLQVYQKKECPLGHEVSRIVQAGRSTFFCPHCQK